jgi:sodium/potassium-transporting ATPase subunit alpha
MSTGGRYSIELAKSTFDEDDFDSMELRKVDDEKTEKLLEQDPRLSADGRMSADMRHHNQELIDKREQERLAAARKAAATGVDIDEHKDDVKSVVKKYHTDLKKGLKLDQVELNREEFGSHELSPPKVTPWYVLLAKHMFLGFSMLLWFGAIISLIGYFIQEEDKRSPDLLYIGVVLIVVVILTALFAFYQEFKAGDVMGKFQDSMPKMTMCLRNGKLGEVEVKSLVCGDIVHFKSGDAMPADVLILSADGVKVDNASLTGEAEAQKRSTKKTSENALETENIGFYTTLILEGTGTGLVVRVGDASVIGQIASMAAAADVEKTLMAKELEHFIKIIMVVAIVLGVTFTIISFILKTHWALAIVFGIGIIVANVPEGLLATVTVALRLTSAKMATKQVLVKKLESIETLGSTTMICSDKTGTLTQNRMSVSHAWFDQTMYECPLPGREGDLEIAGETFQMLHDSTTLCTTAYFEDLPHGADVQTVLDCTTKGDASESALIKFTQPLRDIEKHRKEYPVQLTIPFNSAVKYMAVVRQGSKKAKDTNLTSYLKGAPERVLERCDFMLINGEEVPLDEELEAKFTEAYEGMGGMGERVLGFAYRRLSPKKYPAGFKFKKNDKTGEWNFPLEGMVFVGLLSLIDPPKPGVPEAVTICRNAGIRVAMVTGDHPITAKAIAQDVGIITLDTVEDLAAKEHKKVSEIDPARAGAIVLHGEQLVELEEEDWDRVLAHKEIVFARTSPKQKLQIVENNQRRFEVVAVTGDGVNDSPALRKADIGISMNISGSDVSKEASDMILLDDNFASIVKGIEEGRLIFDNLKKSISYTLTSNIPEISPFLMFVVLQLPLPLTTVLILMIDLGTDLWPAISLAYEEAESDIMQRTPRDARTDRLVTNELIGFAYLQIGIMQALAGFFAYFTVLADFNLRPNDLFFKAVQWDQENTLIAGKGWLYRDNALKYAQTAFFVSIIVVQWADVIITKTRRLSITTQGMNNWVLNSGLLFETLLAVVFVYTPPLNWFIFTRPLKFVYWLPGLPFSVLIFAYDELRKFLIRLHPRGFVNRWTYY